MLKIKTYLLVGIPILFVVGALFHFIYNFSDQNFFIGLIAPVNESVWEHTKMVLVPLILYWSIYYFINKNSIDRNNWFLGCLVSLSISIISIIACFYTYSGALGYHITIVDILILLISLALGQFLGIHIYFFAQNKFNYLISIIIMLLIFITYIFFTLYPPKIPLFIDETNNCYGLTCSK